MFLTAVCFLFPLELGSIEKAITHSLPLHLFLRKLICCGSQLSSEKYCRMLFCPFLMVKQSIDR